MKYNFNNSDSIDYGKIEDWKDFRKQRDKWFDEQMAVSNSLPDGLQVGKIFTMSVADGYAYYEVVKINKTTVRIKWRKELCPDHYSDMILGHGGSFQKRIIEPIINMQDGWKKIMVGKKYWGKT